MIMMIMVVDYFWGLKFELMVLSEATIRHSSLYRSEVLVKNSSHPTLLKTNVDVRQRVKSCTIFGTYTMRNK